MCRYVADENVEPVSDGVCDVQSNKDEFEITSSGPCVSGMACVGSYHTLLVESERFTNI